MNIVQCSAWTANWRVPSGNELRYLANTSLAYGAQGICYFAYDKTADNPDSEGGGIRPNPDGSPTTAYTAMQSINPKFVAIAKQVQPLHHIGAYHLGDLPYGFDTDASSSPARLPSNSPFSLSPTVLDTNYVWGQPVSGMLVGLFGPDAQLANATFAMVTNLDYTNSVSTTVNGPGNLSVFDAATGTWTAQNHSWATLTLLPGDGILVGLTSAIPEPSTVVLLITGLIGMLAYVWRRHK